jgi:hypothetical protein
LSHILYTLVYYDTNISKSAEEEEEGPFHESAVISEEEDAPNSDIDFHEEDANATTFYATTDGVIVTDTSRTAAADLITTSFRDFHIVVDGMAIDCKLPERQRRAYCDLCRSQSLSSLHQHLISRLNTALVVGVIADTVDIAERVRGRGVSALREDLVAWKTTLQSFQHLGMDVAFIIRRLDALIAAVSSRDLAECDKYRDLKLRQARAGERVKDDLELQLACAKDSLRKASARKSDMTLLELAAAPW